MVSSSGHRPPVTEDVAEAMIKDIKSSEGKTPTSEVPLAFQTGTDRPHVDPVVINNTRKQMTLFGTFAVVVLLILVLVWWVA
ncbi:hypothetical protein [Pararhizobium sp. O133]|uniref:hypothetical protein n=1 Tax=Pararhizobium sp. O133 TaxID=3449278 RepID=UPI003F689401